MRATNAGLLNAAHNPKYDEAASLDRRDSFLCICRDSLMKPMRRVLLLGCRYARNVEIANGRAAMIGFLGSTVVEAATGKGILSQVLWYLKLVNILGPASGF